MIAKARVPIVKFVEKKSGVSFDIRFSFLPFAPVASKAYFANFMCVNFQFDEILI